MALAGTCVAETRPGSGSDLNGGIFNSAAAGVDYSQQNSAQVTLTTTSTVHTDTTAINVVGHTVSANDVGNIFNNTGGTSTPGLYEIQTVDVVNNRWGVDRSVGTAGQTVDGRMGGAFASHGKMAASLTRNGQKGYGKNTGTDTLTTSTPGSAGPIVLSNTIDLIFEGYTTTRGDELGPTIDAGAVTGITIFATQGAGTQAVIGFNIDGAGGASNIGMSLAASRSFAYKCTFTDCVTGIVGTTTRTRADNCAAIGCSTRGFLDINARGCTATTCGVGFEVTATVGHISQCVAYANTTWGFQATGTPSGFTWEHCTADANGSGGFDFGTGSSGLGINLLSTNHSGVGDVGYLSSGTGGTEDWSMLINCAVYNNTTNFSGTYHFNRGSITCTGDPYVNRAGNDFRPNNTGSAGALLRGTAIGVYGMTTNRDIGALQSASSSSGRTNPFFGLVC